MFGVKADDCYTIPTTNTVPMHKINYIKTLHHSS